MASFIKRIFICLQTLQVENVVKVFKSSTTSILNVNEYKINREKLNEKETKIHQIYQ